MNYSLYPNAICPEFIYESANAVAFVEVHLKSWGGNGEIISCVNRQGRIYPYCCVLIKNIYQA